MDVQHHYPSVSIEQARAVADLLGLTEYMDNLAGGGYLMGYGCEVSTDWYIYHLTAIIYDDFIEEGLELPPAAREFYDATWDDMRYHGNPDTLPVK